LNLSLIFFSIAFFSWVSFAAFQAVDINNASKEQIMALPGIGDKLARRIIEHREKKGAFLSVEDLLLIEGCKPKLLEKIKGQILLKKKIRTSSEFRSLSTAKKGITVSSNLKKNSISDEEIRVLMLSFASEPLIRSVQEEAIRYANANPSQVDSWLRRVRQAAWMPKINTKGGRDLDKGQSVREKVGDLDVLYHKESANWSFNLQAEWKLGELIFNREELSVARESVRQTILREDIIEDVTNKYFERRRLQILDLIASEEEASIKIMRQVKIQELTAQIDGFTGGWFSGQLNLAAHS
jgi:competence ComEA-like helix-hairpin-helix protein